MQRTNCLCMLNAYNQSINDDLKIHTWRRHHLFMLYNMFNNTKLMYTRNISSTTDSFMLRELTQLGNRDRNTLALHWVLVQVETALHE